MFIVTSAADYFSVVSDRRKIYLRQMEGDYYTTAIIDLGIACMQLLRLPRLSGFYTRHIVTSPIYRLILGRVDPSEGIRLSQSTVKQLR